MSAAGWSPMVICAALLIEHPGRHRLPLRSSELHVLQVVTAEFSHDGKVVSPVKWMKRIPNRNIAPVAGIIPCWRPPPLCRLSAEAPRRSRRAYRPTAASD